MKKLKAWSLALLAAGSLAGFAGCSQPAEKQAESELSSALSVLDASSQSQEDNLITYTVVANADTSSIKNGNLEYVPFCEAKASQIGKEIGTFTYPGEAEEYFVYEMQDQPSDQWVIVTGADQSNPQIYREMQVENYSEGFVSSYPWN